MAVGLQVGKGTPAVSSGLRGYGPEKNSWVLSWVVPRQELVEEFHAAQPDRPSPTLGVVLLGLPALLLDVLNCHNSATSVAPHHPSPTHLSHAAKESCPRLFEPLPGRMPGPGPGGVCCSQLDFALNLY